MVYKMTDKQVLGKLKTKYEYDVAWELYYLYRYLLSENRENEFDKIVEVIKDKTNIRIVTEYVKAITHNIPVEMIKGVDDSYKLNELRRFLEDIFELELTDGLNECDKQLILDNYLEIARDTNSTDKILYELRRFVKNRQIKTLIEVIVPINYCKVYKWQVLDYLLLKSKKNGGMIDKFDINKALMTVIRNPYDCDDDIIEMYKTLNCGE